MRLEFILDTKKGNFGNVIGSCESLWGAFCSVLSFCFWESSRYLTSSIFTFIEYCIIVPLETQDTTRRRPQPTELDVDGIEAFCMGCMYGSEAGARNSRQIDGSAFFGPNYGKHPNTTLLKSWRSNVPFWAYSQSTWRTPSRHNWPLWSWACVRSVWLPFFSNLVDI